MTKMIVASEERESIWLIRRIPLVLLGGYDERTVTTVKQHVRVEAGGRIALQSAELREGESAEVTIMVDRVDASNPHERLNALNQLRVSLKLTPESACAWESDVRAERQALGRPTAE